MNTVEKLSEVAIKKLKEKITDEVFLIIQNDKDLMYSYLKLVEEIGLNAVNRGIGKAVKKSFNLENDNYRSDAPASTLIQSHQIFK